MKNTLQTAGLGSERR